MKTQYTKYVDFLGAKAPLEITCVSKSVSQSVSQSVTKKFGNSSKCPIRDIDGY